MQVKKQQLEPDIEQWTGSKLRKEYIKAVCCHLAYLTCMPSKSCKMLDWMKNKLESRLLWEISINSYADAIILMADNKEELKILLIRVVDDSEKADLK